MKYLQKKWVRIIVSLFIGAMISEIIHISTGDPNRPRPDSESAVMIVSAIILYYLLTNLSKQTR
jgi:hypothetical protein